MRAITVGDLSLFDFDEALELSDTPTFLVQYHTLRKIVLGRLIITDYEVIFEPLNLNLKGKVDQLSSLISRRLL